MKLPRRQFLHLAAGAAALPAISRFAWAQAYPARPVRIFVGFPAGSGIDRDAHIVGGWLAARLGQSFDIENRLGAGTNIATEAVVRSPPDGYALLLANTANAINATLYDRLNFNFVRDIAPVAGLVSVPIVIVVNPSFPAKTVPELIAYAKANPGKVAMASPFSGTLPHLAAALFKMTIGSDMPHVPYPGGRARAQRPGRRQGTASIFRPWRGHGVYQARQTAGARGDDGDAHGIFARCPDGWGFLARLRGDHMAGDRRAQGHARRDYRKAE